MRSTLASEGPPGIPPQDPLQQDLAAAAAEPRRRARRRPAAAARTAGPAGIATRPSQLRPGLLDFGAVTHSTGRGMQSGFQELLDEFLLEARERTDEVESLLLKIASGDAESRREAIAQAKRELHTLKGNSGMMGFSDLQQIAHHMEDQVEALDPSHPVVDEILVQLDSLRRGLEGIRSPLAEEEAAPAPAAKAPAARRPAAATTAAAGVGRQDAGATRRRNGPGTAGAQGLRVPTVSSLESPERRRRAGFADPRRRPRGRGQRAGALRQDRPAGRAAGRDPDLPQPPGRRHHQGAAEGQGRAPAGDARRSRSGAARLGGRRLRPPGAREDLEPAAGAGHQPRHGAAPEPVPLARPDRARRVAPRRQADRVRGAGRRHADRQDPARGGRRRSRPPGAQRGDPRHRGTGVPPRGGQAGGRQHRGLSDARVGRGAHRGVGRRRRHRRGAAAREGPPGQRRDGGQRLGRGSPLRRRGVDPRGRRPRLRPRGRPARR